nr:hypothetical protein [Tanacetum cinerariifolium]
ETQADAGGKAALAGGAECPGDVGGVGIQRETGQAERSDQELFHSLHEAIS